MASKIIVLGEVNCQLTKAFTKLSKLHTKQNFAFAIIVGNLFGNSSTEKDLAEITELLQGNINVPVPTYFTIGDQPLPAQVVEKIESNNDEVCPNLYFLGKRGTLKTSEGIRIGALGGKLEASDSKKPESNASGKFQATYTESDARALFGAQGVDILITNQWPKGIRVGSKAPLPEDSQLLPPEVQCVADICSKLKPRYHFSTSGPFYYEREPFFHMPTEDEPNVRPITRFISMAEFGSDQKALYAFNLDPKAAPPLTLPPGTTAAPFSAPQKRKAQPSQGEEPNHRPPVHPRKRARERAPPPGPENCFFCLSNPKIATHLITSIGNEAYLTTAKGPLPPDQFFPSLGFPGHMLIIPFSHSPTLDLIQDAESRAATYKEMQQYRSALHQMVSERSGGKLGAVTWEVSRVSGIHTHWQFLPVPIHLLKEGLVDAAFMVEAENLQYPAFTKIPASESKGPDEVGDFFRLWVWAPAEKDHTAEESPDAPPASEGQEHVLMLELTPDFRFDLNYGRRVMAKLLELDRRMNWRDATQSVKEEEVDAAAFKEAFKKYDFTME
ncbi:hypothetical protein N7470_009939 [Penicillium chermesinum]|nr:hypothetical protein N7470_009939 [Penicillium chermesinum]